jgi:hypothetical protein
VTGSGGRLDDPRHPDHRKPYVQNYIDQFDVRKVEANALVVRPAAGRQLCLDTILKYLPEGAPDGYQDRLEEPREHLLALCLILIYVALSAPLPYHQTSGFVEKTRGRCGRTSEQTTTGTEVDEPDPETRDPACSQSARRRIAAISEGPTYDDTARTANPHNSCRTDRGKLGASNDGRRAPGTEGELRSQVWDGDRSQASHTGMARAPPRSIVPHISPLPYVNRWLANPSVFADAVDLPFANLTEATMEIRGKFTLS